MKKIILTIALVMGFSVAANAGVTITGADTPDHINSLGQRVFILTATSDVGPITSLGFKVEGDGNLGQVHPAGMVTPDMINNNFFFDPWGSNVLDTHVLFYTYPSEILVVGGTDTADLLEIGITGFEPFVSREVVQIVLTDNGTAEATIGAVVDGVEYVNMVIVPEPAGVLLVAAAGLAALWRR